MADEVRPVEPEVNSEADPGLTEELVVVSPDAVVVVDGDGTILMASPALRTLFGYEPHEVVGQPVEVLMPPRFQVGHVRHRRGYLADPHTRPMGAGLELEGRRKDGIGIPIDVALAPVDLGDRRLVAAFIRDITERRRTEAVLRFSNEVNQALLSDGDIGAALNLIAGRARRLVGGSAAWIVAPTRSDGLVVAAADGPGADSLLGVPVPEDSLSARTMADRKPVGVVNMSEDPEVLLEAKGLGLGPGLYVPLAADDVVGALVLARTPDQEPFRSADVSVAEVFASAAGVALSLGRARAEIEELRFATEHDRIARDLHDTVIQRLFALGMGLQGAQRLASPPVAERIDSAVDAIDQVIREIRETIFDLQRPPVGHRIRDRLREVTSEATAQLGFAPTLSLRGPVETTIADSVVPHLVAVLREALSNTARHARATRAEVVVAAEGAMIGLRVTDDGVGLPAERRPGHGLANMAARATALGGSFRVEPRPGGGTLLEWDVPAGPA